LGKGQTTIKKPWRRLVLLKRVEKWSLVSVRQRFVKTGGRLIKHVRYSWLPLAGSHLTWRLCGSMERRINTLPVPAGHSVEPKGNRSGQRREGMERCMRDRLKLRQFLVSPYPEEAGLSPSWAAGVARGGKDEKMSRTEAIGCTIAAGYEGKMEILGKNFA
jgi:hypothetical protein